RYGPRIADSDLMRARAGSLLRGVPLTVLEGPNGVGGPVETPPGSSPPLTPSSSAIINAGSNPAEDDLSITGATPLSPGPPVTQPLLQGFGLGLNGRYIRIARNDERMSDLVFRQQVISTVWNVINLYWDLVSLNEDVRVKREALDLAQKLLEDNKARVEVGTLAPLEVTRAEAEVAQARQNLTNAGSVVLEQGLA